MTDRLELVLRFTADEAGNLVDLARRLDAEMSDVTADLDRLEARIAPIADMLGVVVPEPTSAAPVQPRRLAPAPETKWEDLMERASKAQADGVTRSDLDELLNPGQVERIERVHGSVELRASLDGYDIAAILSAAVVGLLTDLLVVKVPTGVKWAGEWQAGSVMTCALRSHAVDHDNWIASLARVPFDRVTGTGIGGMGPRSHRVQTFGHDPFFGLVMGTTDILRGTLTGADPAGNVRVVEIDTAMPADRLVTAMGLQIAHLLSDVGTRMGLPLPGWTALMAVPVGSVGPRRPVAEVARWMYLRGYGSWHFLTMATVPAAIETVIRSYIGLRRLVDEEYDHLWAFEAARSGATTFAGHPRYRSISLLAHGMAALGNAGKVTFAAGNPLAVNYTEWMVFIKKLAQSIQPAEPVDNLIGLDRANRITLDAGWVRLGIADSP